MKFAHCVFFTLNDKSDVQCESLIAAGLKYLKPHDGIVSYSMGRREPEMQRPVNDQEFDVCLAIVFADRAAHDAYQVSDPHNEFIAEQKENWKQVRVFDSNVA
ncbi:Stress responsive A/B Barrel Domain protein [Rosistilla carotiformis]|uniref:Stress responsive A/B Barrel Domain protein n=1 Tax=Rosistilla carotiformis TaxID=2528017 RepID=A0A518JRP5_9BACT|nr:Dabb family protein [Rosistilla carotiformis]QDV68200.1 Stress responsive A/B Barrel Domain protein [Rosistilla carotiformis]